jgi:hypothetical protein
MVAMTSEQPATLVVLAGGSNTRLGPLRGTLYKPFLPIHGLSLLARHLARAELAGIGKAIVFVDHYDPLAAMLLEQSHGDSIEVLLRCVPGSMEAKLEAAATEVAQRPLVVVLGDSYALYDPCELHRRSGVVGTDSVLAVAPYRLPFGVIEADSERVERFSEKPTTSYLVATGQLGLGSLALEQIGTGRPLQDVLADLATRGQLASLELAPEFVTVDSLFDIASLNARPDFAAPINGSLKPGDRLPIRRATALLVESGDGRFLCVRRPPEDLILGDVWGLPAVDMHPGESWIDAAHRVGREKLGVDIEVSERLGDESVLRTGFILHLTEFAARIVSGEPSVPQPGEPGTQYRELDYVSDPRVLCEAAQRGSACSRIFLRTQGIPW